jgi:hypothetical protein
MTMLAASVANVDFCRRVVLVVAKNVALAKARAIIGTHFHAGVAQW